MAGVFNGSLVGKVQESFEYNCLSLFGEAYAHIKENAGITLDWDEENISANFFEYIDKSENASKLNINIENEYRLNDIDILSGLKVAKKASRIDFRMTCNFEQPKTVYFIEAKNLIETDCYKTGRTSIIKAKEKHERYINTGIDHFVTGKYPQKGCIVGYVIQGEPTMIVEKINICLQKDNRISDYLQPVECTIPNLDFCYQSKHPNGINIKHFLLKFSA